MPILYRVAILAAILEGCPGELIIVGVLVAIRAGGKLHLIKRVFTCRNVALCAIYLSVFAFQRILRTIVFFHAEQGRLPSVNSVTLGAFAFPGPPIELTLVRIRRVAVFASRKKNLFLEIVLEVAGRAGYPGVFSKERVLGLGMIKIEARQHSFPTAGRVAGFARLSELSAMRVHVASRAGREFHVLVSCCPARCIRFVTFLAGHLDVQASQRVPRPGVIKIFGGLPTFHVMALGAFVA